MEKRFLKILILMLFSISILWLLCPVTDKIPSVTGLFLSHNSKSQLNLENDMSGISNILDKNDQSEGHDSSVLADPNGLADPCESKDPSEDQSNLPGSVLNNQPFKYYTVTKQNQNMDLSMHILELDPSSQEIEVKPVSSHATLFGYDYLSSINDKWNALATINGGFSHPDGLLGGLYAIGGRLLTPGTGRFPVLSLKNGKAVLSDVSATVRIIEENDEKIRTVLDGFYYNQFPKGDGLYVFTPDYGSGNRISVEHLNAVFSQGEIRGLISKSSSYEIPKDGFLISAIGSTAKNRLKESISPGMKLKIDYNIKKLDDDLTDSDWSYECGSWVVRDGVAVSPKADTWVGTLTIRTPRTAVGIKADGNLVFVVADGRQKGLSDGLTGDELARELIELGIVNAAFLDGGASSEIIIGNKIVNSPSAGRERKLACAFVITDTFTKK